MGITDNDVRGFTALAGPDFTWSGVRGSSRPASDVRGTLRNVLRDMQGDVCFACGEALNGGGEFCHIVSRGPGGSDKGKGWLPGNIGIGHAACNKEQQERGPIVHIVDMKRPDVVATEWPPFPVLRQMR